MDGPPLPRDVGDGGLCAHAGCFGPCTSLWLCAAWFGSSVAEEEEEEVEEEEGEVAALSVSK